MVFVVPCNSDTVIWFLLKWCCWNGEYLQWKSMFSYSSAGFSVCAECSDDCTKGSLNRYLDWPSCHTYMQFWWLRYSTSWHGELFIYWFLNMLDPFTFFQSYSWSDKYNVYVDMLCSCFYSDAGSCLKFDPCVGWSLTFSQHVIKSTTFCAAHRRNWTTETFPKRMESSGLYIFNWIDL